jgi:hypothetical protein
MPRITAFIAGQPYRGSLMRMGDGTYCLGVLKSIQEAAGLGFGDTVTIEFALDTAPRLVEPPADLALGLARDKGPRRVGRSSPSRTRRKWRSAC